MSTQASTLSPNWQKAQAVSVIAASLAVPIVVAISTNAFAQAQKNQELGARYVELAVSILRSEPSKGNKALRPWAVAVVDHFSPVRLPDEAKTELEIEQLLIELQLFTSHNEIMQKSSEISKKLHEKAMTPVRNIR